MLHNVEFKNFSPSPRLRELTEELIGRLDRLSPNFASDTIYMRFFMDENPSRRLYHVTLSCAHPGRRMAAKEEAHDPEVAVRAAFAEIERQFERHKEIKGQPYKIRKYARLLARLRELSVIVPGAEQDRRKAA
jgi:ribosome-associated translation inhibitor RaiA